MDMQSDWDDPYMTPAQASHWLGVAPVTLRGWARKGWLRADLTAGGHRRFRRDEVRRFARERGLTLRALERGRRRLLIVDDDRDFVDFLLDLVAPDRHRLVTRAAYDGFEAGVAVASFKPDIVLLDLMMPGLDGFAVCERLKSEPETRGIRVIAMTGYPSDENLARIRAAGAETCLAKPFEPGRLLDLLELVDAADAVPA